MAKQANKFKNGKNQKQKKEKQYSSRPDLSKRKEKIRKIIGFFLVFFSLFLFFAFISYFFTWWIDFDKISASLTDNIKGDVAIKNWTGYLGALFSNLLIRHAFGISSFLIPFILLIIGCKLAVNLSILPLGKTIRYSILIMIWLSLTLGFLFKGSEKLAILGGIFGFEGTLWLNSILGKLGTGFLLFFIFIATIIAAFNVPGYFRRNPFSGKKRRKSNKYTNTDRKQVSDEDTYNTVEFAVEEDKNICGNKEENKTKGKTTESNGEKKEYETDDVELTIEERKKEPETTTNSKEPEHKTINTEYDPKLDLPQYQYPPLSLLEKYEDGDKINVQKDELEENKNRIVITLNHYAIKIDKIRATIGPAVTLYEIIPAPGIRISKIKNLEDDIALSLAALGIRIIAPIPGRGTIGIEVPNKHPEIVSIKSILESDTFSSNKYELPIGIGKTISNEPFIADLTKMPHILMAGATGQGKSVGLNAIITSLLYKKHPAQVKFVMVDPKKVELTLFSKIERHFLAKLPDTEEAIITETRSVVRTLNSLNIEMDNRYDLLKDAQVRNIKEYNIKFIARKLNPMEGHRFLPYIILVVDEFADLIMTAGKEIESPLTRLAQLARAIGIHLIIATQRPSVNIITGTIKANFPARIAYRVISKVDSRTILDSSGADQLIGRGDMLLSTGSELLRLQCAFVDTDEVEQVTDYIGSQRAYPEAYNLPEYEDEESEAVGEYNPNERDELFEDAAKLIVQTQQGSTSLLQRKLKLGYNRAGRIIDQLEAAGIVGPFEGSKAREVKIANEFALEQYLKDLDNKD